MKNSKALYVMLFAIMLVLIVNTLLATGLKIATPAIIVVSIAFVVSIVGFVMGLKGK